MLLEILSFLPLARQFLNKPSLPTVELGDPGKTLFLQLVFFYFSQLSKQYFIMAYIFNFWRLSLSLSLSLSQCNF